MTAIQTFIKRYSIAAYFTLVFAISWGSVLIAVGPGGIPGTPEQTETLLPVIVLATLAGPSVAGLLLTGLTGGRKALRELLSRLLRWRRVGARWYAVLLATPMLVATILLALSLRSTQFLPAIITTDDRVILLLIGLAYGLAAGFFEELGWTGFALPRLRRRYSIFTTGLVMGLVWGAWHFLVALWGSGTASGALSLALFLPWIPWNLAVLPAFRVLMVWVHERTESLLLAMLMHATLTASLPLILMPATTGASLFAFYLIFAAALWIVVAAVAATQGGHFKRQTGKRPQPI